MTVAPGARLGPYEILAPLGAGGMGEVFKARDTRLDRVVAIKILPASKVGDPDRKARFIQEARAASALNHPNIVILFDIAAEAGIDYLVMEFVAGKSLEQIIPRRGLPAAEALRFAVQIADALAAAHAANIVHRDLKPGNIMVADSGVVKILDFGLAKLGEAPISSAAAAANATQTMIGPNPKTADGLVLGTAAYMSPEQAEARPVDRRSDIFSFGAVLYEILSGVRAFERDTTLSTLSAVLRDDPRPLRDTTGGLPVELERIINRCLRKDPGARFHCAADLRVALTEVKQEFESGKFGAVDLPARKRRAALPAAAASIALLAAAVWFWQSRPAPAAEALNLVPVTSYSGFQGEPTLSPDGNQVAFSWQKEGEPHAHIYVKLIGPGAPLAVTSGTASEHAPAWSPDGSTIAFVRISRQNAGSVVVIPALGGPERVLVADHAGDGQISWSPDGQWIGHETLESGRPTINAVSVVTGEIHPMIKASSDIRIWDGSPAISPDGRTLAFARRVRSGRNLFAVGLSSDMQARGEPRQLVTDPHEVYNVSWTPDGREIVFRNGYLDPMSIWRVSASGGAARRIREAEGASWPSFSRPRPPLQLARLAYEHKLSDDNIWKLPMIDGKPGEPIRAIYSPRRDWEPRYSSDGERVVFSSVRDGAISVWVANADGGNVGRFRSNARRHRVHCRDTWRKPARFLQLRHGANAEPGDAAS